MRVEKDFNEVIIVVGIFLAISYYFVYVEFIKAPDAPPPEDCAKEIIQLSKLINSEADKSDTLDMFLVGSTVLNRRDSESFPDTQDSVIKQRGQYSGYGTTQYTRTDLSDSIATRLYRGEGRNFEVLYFYSKKRATDKGFLKLLGDKHDFITRTKVHMFYGAPIK